MIPRSYPTDSNGRMVVAEVSTVGKTAWVDYIPIQYSNMVACLNLDGTDAATTFTDEAGTTWSASGNAQLDTAQKKYGVASLLCDGTGDYISCTNNTEHDCGAGDFTVEGWVRYNTVATPGSRWISKWTTAGNLESWKIGYVFSGNLLRFSYTTNGSTDVDTDAAFTPVAGTWYHFAACRYNNTLTTYIDGVAKGTRDMTGVTIATVSTVTRIGRGDTSSDHNGWLEELKAFRQMLSIAGRNIDSDRCWVFGGVGPGANRDDPQLRSQTFRQQRCGPEGAARAGLPVDDHKDLQSPSPLVCDRSNDGPLGGLLSPAV